MTKLLHPLAISFPLVVLVCVALIDKFFLKGFWSVYATCLQGTWYGFASSLTRSENVPLKHPIPVNTPLYS